MPKMDLLTLKSLLADEKAAAMAAQSAAELSQERSDAMDYYLGDMSKDMPTQEGKSKAVSTDVMDTIEGLMPPLMDIFCGSDEVVRFEPVGPEDEDAAQQETDYTNHVFMQQNPGFMVLYSFIKDALLQKVGIVKVFAEEYQDEQRETYLDQSDDAFALLAQAVMAEDSGLEIIEHTPKTDEATGAVTHDVTVLTTKKGVRSRVMGVPPEEFGIERNARDIKTCNYCFHEVNTKTEADLIAEGYDEQQIKALGDYTGTNDSERLARDSVDESSGAGGDINPAARLVKITEHYIRLDYEGKGRPCLYQVVTGGDQGEILRRDGKEHIEPYDMIPFATTTPVPITHRFFGRSIADLVMDIQRIKTALTRAMLDNMYLHVNPRVEIAESHSGPNTIDDLLVSRAGGVVRTKTPGGLQWQVVPNITDSIYPALQYMDATREMRTGVTKQGQGVDANALQNQSATAVNQVFTASQARMKLIARIMAEGVRDIFSLLHATIRKHGGQAETVRLRNSWVQVDPRNWKTRNDMTINVGLGNGGKAEQFAQTMALANFQKELVLGGKTNIVDDAKLFATAAELAKIMGHKSPDKFFNDPSAKDPQTGQPMHPAPPPPEDPKVTQIKMQAELQKAADERKGRIETLQAEADIATNREKVNADIALNRDKAQMQKELAVLQFNLDEARDQREHQLKMAQLNAKLSADRETHQMKIEQGAFQIAAGAEAHGQKMEQNKAAAEAKGAE
jgi:hypothetical protein